MNIGVRHFRLKLLNLGFFPGESAFRFWLCASLLCWQKLQAQTPDLYESRCIWSISRVSPFMRIYIWAKIWRQKVFCAFGHIQFSVLRISTQKYWFYPKRATLAICFNLLVRPFRGNKKFRVKFITFALKWRTNQIFITKSLYYIFVMQ